MNDENSLVSPSVWKIVVIGCVFVGGRIDFIAASKAAEPATPPIDYSKQFFDWESNVGTKIRAALLDWKFDAEKKENVVRLVRESDGTEIKVPISQLSEKSGQQVKNILIDRAHDRQVAELERIKQEKQQKASEKAEKERKAQEIANSPETKARNARNADILTNTTRYVQAQPFRNRLKLVEALQATTAVMACVKTEKPDSETIKKIHRLTSSCAGDIETLLSSGQLGEFEVVMPDGNVKKMNDVWHDWVKSEISQKP